MLVRDQNGTHIPIRFAVPTTRSDLLAQALSAVNRFGLQRIPLGGCGVDERLCIARLVVLSWTTKSAKLPATAQTATAPPSAGDPEEEPWRPSWWWLSSWPSQTGIRA